MLDTRRTKDNARQLLGRHGRRIALVAVGLTLLGAAVAGAASFVARSWNNAAGGGAATAANWSPNGVPTSADDLTFNLANTYGVTFNSTTNASRTHTYRAGTVSLTASSPHTVSNGITVGSLSGDVATTTHTSGLVTSNAAVVVGNTSGATGTLTVNGSAADMVLATTAGDLTVGNSGAGTLNVTNFGLVQVADRFQAGNGSTGTGNVTVSGGNSLPLLRSTFDVDGTTQASSLGAAGDATMNVSNGGLASFAGSLNVAQGAASVSSLTIGGLDVFQATVTLGADLGIGRNTAPSSAGGFGVVTVNDEGVLDVGGTTNIGNDPDGGTGFLVVNTGAAVTTGSLAVGATGELDLNGGTLDIDGGTFTYANSTIPLVIKGADDPLVTLRNGAAATLQNVSGPNALVVGGGAGSGAGTFDVRSGSSLDIVSGDVVIGTDGDDGSMVVNGFGGSTMTMNPLSNLRVGVGTTGFFEAELGAIVTLGDFLVGTSPGGTGTALIEGLGTNVTFQFMQVGGLNAVSGTANIRANAVCSGASATSDVVVEPEGTLILLNATLEADEIEIFGDATITNGVINANAVNFNNDAVASGTISGDVSITAGAVTLSAGSGDLTLGDASSPFGFVNSGVLDCNSRTVTLLDFNGALLGTASLAGGAIVAPNGVIVTPNDSLFGTGTIDANVANSGKLAATGPAGLTFKGIVTGVGDGFHGTVANFVGGGGFVGSGEIETSITADSTSSFTLTGGLILGDNPIGNDFGIDGAINVGAHTLNIIDVDTAELGGVTTLDGGVIFTTDMLLRGNGVIQGRGAVNANFVGQPDTRIIPTGPLSIGNSTTIEGFKTAGRIEVGAHTLTINTDEFARLGRSTTIAGGSLGHSGNDAFYLEAADTISGFGTISGGIREAPGSVIRAEGALTIGTSLSGVTIFPEGGLLDVNSSAVTLLGVSASNVSSLTTIAGGSLSSTAPVTVVGEGVLRGFGTIDGPMANYGTIDVGAPIGVLTVTGDLDNATGGAIAIQVGGAGNFDKLVVDGRLDLTVLGGGTLRIGALPGLVVSATDSFSVISGDPLVGQFDEIVFDDPYLDNLFDVVYTPTQVFLIARAATGVDLPPIGDPRDGVPSDDGDGVSGAAIPEAFGLRLASRNPFSASDGASFEYDVPRAGSPVAISVYDASGRRVADLVSGAQFAGTHATRWNGGELSALPSGVYFLRMDAGAFGETQRLVLIR